MPLRSEVAFGPRPRDLNPLLHVPDEPVVLDTAAVGAVPVHELRERVARLHESREDIQSAPGTLSGRW